MPCCAELTVYSTCGLSGSNEHNELFDVLLNKIQTLFPHLYTVPVYVTTVSAFHKLRLRLSW